MIRVPKITWNPDIKLAVSDVDETIAEVYTPADREMITELSLFLSEGGRLFMVTGGSLKRVQTGITNFIDSSLRCHILISHCSGAEVWGFTSQGSLRDKPFYSVYEESFSTDMKERWREAVRRLVVEFGLRTHPVQPKVSFWKEIGRDPRDIMIDDRGPQITLEVVNGHGISDEQPDLRIPLMQRAGELFVEMDVPITPRLGGVFALDLAIEGSSKTTSIKYVLENPDALATIGLKAEDLTRPSHFEVWGDKYSVLNGGTDRHMSEALSPNVRSIDFREEDPSEFPEGYNIVLWDGQQRLHHGLLEYMQSRHAPKRIDRSS